MFDIESLQAEVESLRLQVKVLEARLAESHEANRYLVHKLRQTKKHRNIRLGDSKPKPRVSPGNDSEVQMTTSKIENLILLIAELKTHVFFDNKDLLRLSSELIEKLKVEGPKAAVDNDHWKIINFHLVTLSVCIPDEMAGNSLVERYHDEVQALCDAYGGFSRSV